MKKAHLISVIGGAHCTAQEAAFAEAVGRGIAERGHILLCGGRGGIMEAACRGAADSGGMSIGVLPGHDRRDANPFVTIAVPTGLGEVRNLVVARGGEAVIAIGGSHGTLSEIAFALKAGRPVIGLATWQGEDGRGAPLQVQPAETAEEAVRWACERVEEGEKE